MREKKNNYEIMRYLHAYEDILLNNESRNSNKSVY